ncbi:MAG TPA: threonine/serine exporter family protein [Clostridiaceae bacterium]|nr:threonine/serine exporter family protein [Clostridiaceae bacterium]
MKKDRNIENEIVQLAALIGTGLMTNGAETYRVEDSMQSIMESYDDILTNPQVFGITHYITISAQNRSGDTIVVTENVRGVITNFNRVDLLNNLTRRICREKPDPALALADAKAILAFPRYSQLINTGGVALTGFSFTLLSGSTLIPAIWAAVVSALLTFMVSPLRRLGSNRIFINIIRGALVYAMISPVLFTQYSSQVHLMTAGAFMYLFPGIILVNSIRDLIASDYLAGLIKLIETILAATALAIGSGIGSSIMNYIFRFTHTELPPLYSIDPMNPVSVMIAILGVFAFLIIFDVRKQALLVGGVGGGLSWLIYALINHYSDFNYTVAIFIATLFLATYSELMARVTKKPATVYLTAGLFPLVPGYEIYRTMNYFLTGQENSFINSLIKTLMITGTLALGIMLVSSIAKLFYNYKAAHRLKEQ